MYCCDNDSSGDCCKDTDSTFVLGAIVTSLKSVTETKTRSYTTSSSSTLTTSSSSTATKPTSTNTPTTSASTIPSNSGVKIGVGVGLGVGALVIFALALLWFLRRRRNNDQKRSGYGGPNMSHEAESLKRPETPSELVHDRTTEIPAELPQGPNHPVEMDSFTRIGHVDGASSEQTFPNTGTNHAHGFPNESSSLPAPFQDLQPTVRPAFSTSSIVHPGLLDAAATASRYLDRPTPVQTPVQTPFQSPAPTPEPSEQQERSFMHDGSSAPLSPDQNPLLPFPPKTSSKSHIPPPLSANQPSPAVARRLNAPTSNNRPFHSAPPTPRKSFQQNFSMPKQPSIRVVPPTPQQTVKDLPSLPTAQPPVTETAPSNIQAVIRNHPQPLQSNRPLSFASPPSRDSIVHEPYPVDFPLRSSSMAAFSLMNPNAASSASQGLDPASAVGNDLSSTDFFNFQSTTYDFNVPYFNALDSTAIRNYSYKITTQQSREVWGALAPSTLTARAVGYQISVQWSEGVGSHGCWWIILWVEEIRWLIFIMREYFLALETQKNPGFRALALLRITWEVLKE